MRYLNFEKGITDEYYEVIYDGIIGSTRGYAGKSEARVIGRVLDKLEGIGEPTVRGNSATFALSKSGVVQLEDAEYKLMTESLDSVRWTARVARTVAKAFVFLENAPVTEPVKERVVE